MIFRFLPRAAAEAVPDWRQTWPFGPGYSEGWVSVVLKFLLIAVILGAISLFLRYLFGPGGPLRDKEFDEPDADDSRDQNGRGDGP